MSASEAGSNRAETRVGLAAELARVTRSRDLLAELARVSGEGRRSNVVAALPDDPIEFVWDRIREGYKGGTPTVLGVKEGDHWRLAIMWTASEARMQVACEDNAVIDVAPRSHVSMFLDCLHQNGGSVVVRPVVAAKLIERRELAPT
ncbi:hypothetical protein [Actinomycetospora flava]|uniref:Type III secretion system (T3SS) SseB-like protein n=1 Tax=Actinomycetospora flava TaxID=3129232 RepID=A0ABU8LZL4_9PSEU